MRRGRGWGWSEGGECRGIVIFVSDCSWAVKHRIMKPIKEPEGVDLNLEPMQLSEEDRILISEVISEYRKTRKVPKLSQKKQKKQSRKGRRAAVKETTSSTNLKREKKEKVAESGK
jgi:hypothetical protein